MARKAKIVIDARILDIKPGMYTAIVVAGNVGAVLGVYGRTREAAVAAGINWVKANGMAKTIDRLKTHSI